MPGQPTAAGAIAELPTRTAPATEEEPRLALEMMPPTRQPGGECGGVVARVLPAATEAVLAAEPAAPDFSSNAAIRSVSAGVPKEKEVEEEKVEATVGGGSRRAGAAVCADASPTHPEGSDHCPRCHRPPNFGLFLWPAALALASAAPSRPPAAKLAINGEGAGACPPVRVEEREDLGGGPVHDAAAHDAAAHDAAAGGAKGDGCAEERRLLRPLLPVVA